jgi:hypothetical protein
VKENKTGILGGLLARREAWRLTWRGWLLLLFLAVTASVVMLLEAYPFFAPTERVPAALLVIEGWSPPNAMKQVADEYRTGHYQRAVLVRSILDLDDKYLSGQDEGDYLVNLLVKYHMPADKITSLFPLVVNKDRTYHSALEVKKWIAGQGMVVKSLDLITMGPHARRSRLLYEKAFGGQVKIGIIAMKDLEYDENHWWRASEGVRSVMGETIAYLYARFLFRPGD